MFDNEENAGTSTYASNTPLMTPQLLQVAINKVWENDESREHLSCHGIGIVVVVVRNALDTIVPDSKGRKCSETRGRKSGTTRRIPSRMCNIRVVYRRLAFEKWWISRQTEAL